MIIEKIVVAGLGEIGKPILELLSKTEIAVGYDINSRLVNKKKFSRYKELKTSSLHICIPYTPKFLSNIVLLYEQFKPEYIVIHSTVHPGTTEKLQSLLTVPIIYSATRGVHKRMLYDLKRYTKFYAVKPNTPQGKWASSAYAKIMKRCGVKTKKMSNPLTLEIAKIVCDTSYYGWLINYAQLSKMIAIKNNINYDEMWSFAEEIHKYLGNRPKMFPGYIGGHCVIPNLDLIEDDTLDLIREINSDYAKVLKKRKIKGKKL